MIFSIPSSVFKVNVYLKPKGFLVWFMALWGIINIDSILSLPGIGNLFVHPEKNRKIKLIKTKYLIKPSSYSKELKSKIMGISILFTAIC